MKYISTLTIILILFLCSCGSFKDVPYFQDLDRSAVITETIKNTSPYTIQNNDILGIYVGSSANPEAAAPFNFSLNRVNGNIMDNSNTNPIVGYLVDTKGNIDMPLIGTLKVSGYTVSELKEQLLKTLATYLKGAIVNVRILNFKISVMGDVLKPDIYTFQTDNVNITQALSAAGDLTITANRKSLLLIREIDGKRVFIPLDLTSKKLFESPYYYLKSNDVLYVDPTKNKYETTGKGNRTASTLLGIAGILTILVGIYVNNK